MFTPRHLPHLAAAFTAIIFCAAAWGADAPIEVGVVSPSGERIVYSIAIPAIKPASGSMPLEASEPLHQIIYRDLVISGYFKPVEDQGFVEEYHARDQRTGNVQFSEWNQLGAQLLLLADYRIGAGGQLSGTARLISIVDGRQVMGREYKRFTVEDYRNFVHHISDDVVEAITQVRGIASSKIVFISAQGRNKEVFVVDPDGGNLRPLTQDQNLNATPAWGANSTEVYYTSYKNYNPDLCGVRVTRPETWWVSRRQGFNLAPDYSAASRLIALSLGKDGNNEIYTMDRMGRNAKRLTYNISIDNSPSWSPNGNQIAFSSDRSHSGRPDVYVMEANGGNQRRLSTRNYYNDLPDWSPRGDRIVFTSQASRGDDFDIYTMDIAGENWRRLTTSSANDEDPSWAADGEHIVFSSDRSGQYQLYIMNSDGTNVHQVTRRGENYSPDCSPYLP